MQSNIMKKKNFVKKISKIFSKIKKPRKIGADKRDKNQKLGW